MKRLEQVVVAKRERSSRRRGILWQEGRRKAEEDARRRAVEVGRELVEEGAGKKEAAGMLGLDPRTLGRWEERCETESWKPRGRNVERSQPEARNRVILAAELLEPRSSARMLVGLFDDMPRSEVRDISERYWQTWSLLNPVLVHELTWTLPGAVWAMDHAVPPEAIDGIEPGIFSLRDLSSGYQILWVPAKGFGAEEVIAWLERCFRLWGPPLALKSDSGSAFIAEALAEFLRRSGVKHILSPPRRPQYNGSIEASVRWMKARTEQVALAAGRSGAWRREDMERARKVANTARRRQKGAAEETWLKRSPITPETRAAFAETIERENLAALAERGLAPGVELRALERRAVNRDAIRRALVAHGILHFKRRLIPHPIKSTIVDKAS